MLYFVLPIPLLTKNVRSVREKRAGFFAIDYS